ncbi:MAG: hypothetical protein ABIS48_03200, partial [Candidatus Saccharimonadales bacterium]
MKKNATRILLLTIVVLFLVTSSALTIAVIVQSVKDGKKKDATISKTEKPLTTPLANTQLSNFTPVATIDSLQKVDTTAGTGAE